MCKNVGHNKVTCPQAKRPQVQKPEVGRRPKLNVKKGKQVSMKMVKDQEVLVQEAVDQNQCMKGKMVKEHKVLVQEAVDQNQCMKGKMDK